MKPKARCVRCTYETKTNYEGTKCPRCSSFLLHLPIWINGTFV